jgi:hypothetical protein
MPLSGNEVPDKKTRRGHILPGGIGLNAPPPEEDGTPSIQESLREAESRTLDFPAAERAIYIRAMVRRAREYKSSGRSHFEIRELLPEFARDYPHLFDTVIQEESWDESNLNTMLSMLDRMGQGQLNQHQATVIVGQRLAKKYIHSSNSK